MMRSCLYKNLKVKMRLYVCCFSCLVFLSKVANKEKDTDDNNSVPVVNEKKRKAEEHSSSSLSSSSTNNYGLNNEASSSSVPIQKQIDALIKEMSPTCDRTQGLKEMIASLEMEILGIVTVGHTLRTVNLLTEYYYNSFLEMARELWSDHLTGEDFNQASAIENFNRLEKSIGNNEAVTGCVKKRVNNLYGIHMG